MSLTKNPQFPSLKSWMDDFWNTDKFFSDRFATKDLFSAVNVKDRENTYEIELTAPGLKKEDFKIHVENGVLSISCETKKEEEEKNEKFTRKEFSYSAFSRSFSVPENVADEDVEARYENGLLRLTLKKKAVEAPKKKQIEVQ